MLTKLTDIDVTESRIGYYSRRAGINWVSLQNAPEPICYIKYGHTRRWVANCDAGNELFDVELICSINDIWLLLTNNINSDESY